MKKRCFNSKRLKTENGGTIQRLGTHNKTPETAAKKWEKTSISTEAAWLQSPQDNSNQD